LKMQTRGSRFVRFQEMKLQERAIEVRGLTSVQGQTITAFLVHKDLLKMDQHMKTATHSDWRGMYALLTARTWQAC
jgi:hypothetical protein